MNATGLKRTLIAAVSAVLLFDVGAAIAAPTATDPCRPDGTRTGADLDGDGLDDAVVGMPWHRDGAGAVDVRGSGTPAVVLTAGALGAGTGEGDGFGTAIAMGDLDGDGCADLVIGSPAEGQSEASDGAGASEGQVHLVFGGRGGIKPDTAITLPHDSSNLDHFGAALALVPRTAGGVKVHDLYVGAPRAAVGAHALAGEVFRYTITPNPARRVTAALREVRDQNSPGVPGSAEPGDGFGAVLASTDNSGVLVGAPQEDVGSARDAGAVWHLRLNPTGTPIASHSWSQDSPGVPGVPETGDRFGAAVTSRAAAAVVGVPGEDDGSKVDSGMVQAFRLNPATSAFAPRQAITQNTPGIPGTVEAGDRFGAAVALGVALLCPVSVDVAVGAPGEDLGTKADAGSVTLIDPSGDPGCPARAVSQGSGLADTAEPGDQVGAVLGLTRGRTDLEQDYEDRLLIGVPGEDIGAVSNAGLVQPLSGGITANGVHSATLRFSQGYLNAQSYGSVLSSPSD